MDRTGIAYLMLSAVLLTVGCGQNTTPRAATDAELAEARAKDKGVADSLAADAKTRDDYAREVRKQLDGFDKKYAELKDKALAAEGRARTDLESKIAQAKITRDAASRKLDELRFAGTVRWQKVQSEMAGALADVKSAFE